MEYVHAAKQAVIDCVLDIQRWSNSHRQWYHTHSNKIVNVIHYIYSIVSTQELGIECC